MQQPACNYSLEKDEDILEEGWQLDAETELPQCGPENSNSDSVPWKLPATQPLSCMGKTESPCPEEQPQSLGASPLHPLRSQPKKQCENQGSLLHFDRQAPGRISTSPTLRRLRGSGGGMKYSLPQQEASEGPTWGGWKEPAGSPYYLSKSLPGSPKISSHSLSPRLHSRLPLDPTRVLDAADPFEPQAGPTDEAALPGSLPVHEGCLSQDSLSGRGSDSPPSPAAQLPRPQVTAPSLLPLIQWATKQNRPWSFHITPKARGFCDGGQHKNHSWGDTHSFGCTDSQVKGAQQLGEGEWKSSTFIIYIPKRTLSEGHRGQARRDSLSGIEQ